MLEIKIEHFLDYCKVSNFVTRSIQSLRVRLNEFNRFIKKTSVDSVKGISYRHLKVFCQSAFKIDPLSASNLGSNQNVLTKYLKVLFCPIHLLQL